MFQRSSRPARPAPGGSQGSRFAWVALALACTLVGCGSGPLTGVARSGGKLGASSVEKKRPAADLGGGKKAAPAATNVALCFRLLDRNADKHLEPLEWPVAAQDVAAGGPSFQDADKDGDGKLSADEWTAYALPRFTGAPYAAVEIPAALKAADKDADGKLTPDETEALINALPKLTRASLYLDAETAAAWVKKGDKNQDLALDLAELERLLGGQMLRRFADLGA